MKQIEVVAAVIVKDGKIFATQRGYGAQKDGWEFPGGKIEAGETHAQALMREISEELDSRIEVGALLKTVQAEYPEFHLVMHCYLCKLISGALTLKEHENACWLDSAVLESVNWLPADRMVLPAVREVLK